MCSEGCKQVGELAGCSVLSPVDASADAHGFAAGFDGFEGDGRIEYCTGSWETYAEQRAKREDAGQGASKAFKHRRIERAH